MNRSRSAPRYDCSAGRHHSAVPATAGDGDVLRSTCVRCGCALLRTRATRRWILSGALGGVRQAALPAGCR